MKTRLLASVGLAATVALSATLPVDASVGQPRVATPVDAAVGWLVDQQQPDGGFELAGYPGFENPDVIAALAAAGQTGPGWDASEARAAVLAVHTPGGLDALDALDDWIDGVQGSPSASAAAKAQQAAKVIALVTVPLGLDPTDLDPSDDSAAAVDLTAALAAGAGADGSFPSLPFAGRAFALWAQAAVGQTPDPDLLAAVDAARDAAGGWNYLGDPAGTELDPDTTAITLVALRVAGRASSDPSVRGATIVLGRSQRWTGQWAGEFDDGNPNSTALVALAAASLGATPSGPCWRDAAEPRFAGLPYPSPIRAITRGQQVDGRIASPTDGFGISTFPTSQSVQALAAEEGAFAYLADAACSQPVVSASRRLVNAHYLDLLSRFSDAAGAAHWVAQIDGGASPAQLSRRLTGTSEYGAKVVDRVTRRLLGRPATLAERQAGAPLVLAGRRLDVVAGVLGTVEYLERAGGSNGAWVAAVYPDSVGRDADAAGTSWATNQLGAGRTRTQVARLLVGSTEGLSLLVDGFYQDLLRRRVDTAGRDHWVAQIRAGRSPEGLVTLIAGSGEYVALTAGGAA